MTVCFQGLSIDVGEIQKLRVCGGYEEDPDPVWTTEKVRTTLYDCTTNAFS